MNLRLKSVRSCLIAAGSLLALSASHSSFARIDLPPGFELIQMTPNLDHPVAIAFAPDGRLFIAEKRGVVKVIINGIEQPTPFIDLRDEVHQGSDRGMLGIALESDFITGRHLWVAYTVDPVFGEPDESATAAVQGRVTRYQGTQASNGNIAGPNSRHVVMGATLADNLPECWTTHAVSAIHLGPDGNLFIAVGDGAHYEFYDAGGNSADCLANGIIDPAQDIGAFRSQSMQSLAGKILRVNPVTGAGLPDNPFYDGDPLSKRSRVWCTGLRNPFRFAIKPGTSPGQIFVSDVGWDTWEEFSAASPTGGNNFGWPCFEGFNDAPFYPDLTPPDGGCATIGTPSNPGLLTPPIMSWNHSDPNLSIPPGIQGNCAVAGIFSSPNYPVPYRNGFFFADFVQGWIKLAKLDEFDQLQTLVNFATDASYPVDFAIDPITGDVCYLSFQDNIVWRIHCNIKHGDVNQNGIVNIDDLLAVINGWGPCTPPKGLQHCPSDLTDNNDTNIDDLLEVINNWG